MKTESECSIAWLVHGIAWAAAGGALAGHAAALLALGVLLATQALLTWIVFFSVATGVAPSLPPPPPVSLFKASSSIGILCAAAALGMIWLAVAALTGHIFQLAIREHVWGRYDERK